MKNVTSIVFALVLAVAAYSAEPDFVDLTNKALAVQAQKDVLYNDIDTNQSAETIAADHAELNARCDALYDAVHAFYPGIGGDEPDFIYLTNLAYLVQQFALEPDRESLDYYLDDLIENFANWIH